MARVKMNKILGTVVIFCMFAGRAYGADAMLPESPYMSLYNRLENLRKNANAAETSLKNRTITSVSMAALGLGGAKLFSSAAERQVDSDADAAMRAYTATFVCDYGAGRNIKYDTQNVELPGGNILLPLVKEYKDLAADLKARKQALGLLPGIESDIILTDE